jgi:hypothetical protein
VPFEHEPSFADARHHQKGYKLTAADIEEHVPQVAAFFDRYLAANRRQPASYCASLWAEAMSSVR